MSARPQRVQPVSGEPMAEYVTVARVGDVAEGRPRSVRVGTKLIAVFMDGGRYYAVEDTCPHMGSPLSDGEVEAGVVTCAWHGWRFRLADGAWVDSPRVCIPCYPVRVIGDEIQIELPPSRPAGAPGIEREGNS